jgi:hypothetical protein
LSSNTQTDYVAFLLITVSYDQNADGSGWGPSLSEIQVAPLLPLQTYSPSLQAMAAAFREIGGVRDKIEPRPLCVIGSERFAKLVALTSSDTSSSCQVVSGTSSNDRPLEHRNVVTMTSYVIGGR